MDPTLVRQILEAIQKSQGSPIADPRLAGLIAKATFSQSNSPTSGLTMYDLELGAKLLYPVLTPLRNAIPRVGGGTGIQAAWRAVTAINTSGLRIGVSGGNRGGVIAVRTADYTAAFKGIGVESNVDFEAGYAAKGFDDVRALAAKMGLESLMLGEEAVILGGNNSIAFGTTPTPSLTDVGTGGTLAYNTQFSVICVALSLDGVINGSVSGGVQGQITRTNADGSSDTFGGGSAGKSVAATVTTANDSNNTHKITATVTAVNGAVGYAWFWGASGSELLGAITTINSVVITAAAAGTQNASTLSGDNSQNGLIFDGLLTQAFKSGSNAYIKTQGTGTAGAGTPLTSDGAGGVSEIDVMLKDRWDNYRLSFDELWVSSQEQTNISKIVLKGTTTAAQRFVFTVEQSQIAGGTMVTSYRNKYSMAGAKEIPIRLHPNLPAGTILGITKTLPYPLANVPNVMRILTRQEYYQLEWPLKSRKYEYGVYADEVLQHYFPPSMGIITNIGDGVG